MSQRPLSTYGLPVATLALLSRAGYTTAAELTDTSADALAAELNVSEDEAEALLDALRPTRARTFSQAFPGTAIGAAAGPSQLFPPPTFSAIPSSNPASQLLPPAPFGAPALTQSASALFSGFPGTQATAPDPTQPGAIPAPPTPFSFHCAPLDALLDGGLPRGHILELSGPPQTPRDAVALGAVRSALAAGGAVLVVDTQNIIAPRDLKNLLSKCEDVGEGWARRVHYKKVQSLPALLILLQNLLPMCSLAPTTSAFSSTQLPTQARAGAGAASASARAPSSTASRSGASTGYVPKTLTLDPLPCLVYISSVSFPFQSHPTLPLSQRAKLLDRMRLLMSRVAALAGVSILLTSTLATKLVNADGTLGNFDTGASAVMVPALGPGYLPASCSFRVIFVPRARESGVLRLLSSPAHPAASQGMPPPRSGGSGAGAGAGAGYGRGGGQGQAARQAVRPRSLIEGVRDVPYVMAGASIDSPEMR